MFWLGTLFWDTLDRKISRLGSYRLGFSLLRDYLTLGNFFNFLMCLGFPVTLAFGVGWTRWPPSYCIWWVWVPIGTWNQRGINCKDKWKGKWNINQWVIGQGRKNLVADIWRNLFYLRDFFLPRCVGRKLDYNNVMLFRFFSPFKVRRVL